MTQGRRVALSTAQRTELWSRWKAGQSLRMIGRALGKPHNSIHGFLSRHGGIVPPVRRRSPRQCRPKRTDLSSCTQSQLDKIALRL